MTGINATSAKTTLTPTATIELERLISTTELAEALGVSRQTIINAVMHHAMPEPSFIIGKAWGWRGSRLPKHIKARLLQRDNQGETPATIRMRRPGAG